MAFSSPQNIGIAGGVSTSPLTIEAEITTGKEYLLCLSRQSATDAFVMATDDAGSVWTRLDYAPKSGTAGRRVEAWHCIAENDATEVSVTFEGSSPANGVLLEISGGSGVVNAALADHRASSTAPAAVEITPTVARTLVIAFVQANPNAIGAIAPSIGWNEVDGEYNDGPDVVWRYDPSVGVPLGVSWTFGSAAGSGHAIVALEEADSDVESVVTIWDGSTEIPAIIEGVWDGTTVQPAVFDTVA